VPHAVAIAVEDPDRPDIRAKLAEADAFYASLYPAEFNYLLDIASLKAPGVSFHVARDTGGALLGFGAVVLQEDGWAEIKRMYIDPAARGRGVGRAVLAALETHARARGAWRSRLETGNQQPPALALYRSFGYAECGPFGGYADDPVSIFMARELGGG
jgi:putative acetyltransferase